MARRYLHRWSLTVVVCLLMVLGLNGLVDPYGLVEWVRIEGFNDNKPAVANRSSLAKPYQVIRRRPDVLIVGNSRPEMGLNPRHRCFRPWGRAYSLTFPGASFYLQARYLQHAMSARMPKLVLVAVDFLDFLVPAGSLNDPRRWPPAKSPAEDRLRVTARGGENPKYSWAMVRDFRNGLLSLTALGDSLLTVAAQDDPFVVTRTPEGFNPADGYYRKIIRNEGQWVLFEQKKQEVAERLKKRWDLFEGGQRWSRPLETLRRLLQWLVEGGIQASVFINPYHAEYLELIHQSGYGPLFEEWKRQVTQVAGRYAGIGVWDFANFNRYSTEPPPAPGDLQSQLQWFWEPAHYRQQLGDRMLAAMLADSGGCQSEAAASPPGIRLTGANLERHLASQRQARQQYENRHPGLISALRRLFDAT